MRQLEYVRSSTDFIAFLPDGHEHETRTRSSRLSATDIPALVLRTIVTKIAINWSASFIKGSSWSRPQNLVLSSSSSQYAVSSSSCMLFLSHSSSTRLSFAKSSFCFFAGIFLIFVNFH